jgi:hypothetical protein
MTLYALQLLLASSVGRIVDCLGIGNGSQEAKRPIEQAQSAKKKRKVREGAEKPVRVRD